MRTSQQTQKVGAALPYQTVSDLQWDDASLGVGANSVTPRENIIELSVPRELHTRKIYAWLWAQPSNSGLYAIKGRLNFFDQYSNLGFLPLSIGANSLDANASLISIAVTGTNSAQDCIGVYVGKPSNGQPSQVILQPLYIKARFEKLVFSINETLNVNFFRTIIAIISSA